MRLLTKKPTVEAAATTEIIPTPSPDVVIERRLAPPPPGVPRRRRLYVPLRVRVALTILAGVARVASSLWLERARTWSLAADTHTPAAIVVITGIALIPGYLNIQLLVSILLDRPPPLRTNVELP